MDDTGAMNSRGWVLSASVSLILAVIFVVFGGLSHGYSIESISFLALMGILLGAIAAPEIEPKAFRYPALWQACFGAFGGSVFSIFVWQSLEAAAVGALAGCLLGYLAPYWAKHINVP